MKSRGMSYICFLRGIMSGTLVRAMIFYVMISPCLGAALADNKATINLRDANILTLVEMVSEATGKNFIVDPRVRGKVTVVSTHPLDSSELYQTFLSILEVHGFSTVPSGDVIKIVPQGKVRFDSIPTVSSQVRKKSRRYPASQMITRVVRVKNISATQLVPILRTLIPPEGNLTAHAETNSLIISDKSSNIDRIVSIIANIDHSTDSDIDIVMLQHAAAMDVVRVLEGLKSAEQKGGSGGLRFMADDRTNSIMIRGERPARLKMRAMVKHLDQPVAMKKGNTHVVYLHYAKAKDLVPVLSGLVQKGVKDPNDPAKNRAPSQVLVQAEEASNSLVITASPAEFAAMQEVIKRLDIRRAQVLVEAIIAEVSLDKSKALGVEWVIDGTPGNGGPVGVINFNNSSGIANIIAATQGNGVPSIGDGATLGFGILNSKTFNFAVLAKALAGDATTNILSTPSLLTMDNEAAEIVIGQNVPFVTGEFSNSGSGNNSVNPFRTIKREDVGLTLRVTPQINGGDSIQLEIEQEVSSLSSSAVGASDLITNKRQIKTNVMVDDGSTIVLGGLMDEVEQNSERKVPLLGDIPLLGGLFRSSKTTKSKRDLMIFLRPTILREGAKSNRLTSEKYNYIRTRQLEVRRKKNLQTRPSTTPVLPKVFAEIPYPFDLPD